MREPAPARFRPVLDVDSGHLKSIISHARRLRNLTDYLHDFLGSPASLHCTVANEIGPQIVIAVDSPVWATRLRYQSPEIAGHFAEYDAALKDCKIGFTVYPPQANSNTESSSPNRLSAQNAALIRETALSMDNGNLKASLLRLAERGKGTSK